MGLKVTYTGVDNKDYCYVGSRFGYDFSLDDLAPNREHINDYFFESLNLSMVGSFVRKCHNILGMSGYSTTHIIEINHY